MTLLVLCLALSLGAASAHADKRKRATAARKQAAPKPTAQTAPSAPKEAAPAPHRGKEKVFDFSGLNLDARLRTPQLLYFLDRARAELDSAALERRSFVPEMVRSLDEGAL